VFYDKLTFIYLTLPHFQKTRAELLTLQDKWFYIFRHLHELQEVPPELQEAIFLKLFAVANIAQFSPIERQVYEDSLKYYRDLKNVTDTAMDEGINLERQRSILAMVGNGFDAASIAKNLVLPLDAVQKVIDNKT